MSSQDYINQSIIRDMSEGVMVVSMDGVIRGLNKAACDIFDVENNDIDGVPFAVAFFDDDRNDNFCQLILDAIYDTTVSHKGIVPFHNGKEAKSLNVTTSYLTEGDKKIGVIVVISDITELVELQDAVKAMEQIKALNGQLEKRNTLLSKTFGRYLSDDIVAQLMESPNGLDLGGRKEYLSVMITDIRGFTAISERMKPADLISMLNHYLGEMSKAISEYNGTIINFMGDGILVIFGAPLENEHHAQDALCCAISMQQAMVGINEWNREKGYPNLEMGIGLNTGEVIVGNIGSEVRLQYSVTGPLVNMCSRIESYTVGGQILISEEALSAAEKLAAVETNDEFLIQPKGVDGAVTVYNVVGIGEPYNLRLQGDEEELRVLEKPLAVEFRIIDEKHIGTDVFKGEFAALSSSRGNLRCELAELSAYDNIQIDIKPGKLFAKVKKVTVGAGQEGAHGANEELEVHFTSRPEGFEEWLESVQ